MYKEPGNPLYSVASAKIPEQNTDRRWICINGQMLLGLVSRYHHGCGCLQTNQSHGITCYHTHSQSLLLKYCFSEDTALKRAYLCALADMISLAARPASDRIWIAVALRL